MGSAKLDDAEAGDDAAPLLHSGGKGAGGGGGGGGGLAAAATAAASNGGGGGVGSHHPRHAAARGAARVALAAGVSVAWMFVSSGLILLNKHILRDLKFGYPMTVSSMGMLASGLLAFLVVRVLGLADAPGGGGSGAGGGGAGGGGAGGGAGGGGAVVITPRFYLARMAPVGFFMALTLWAGNAVYLRLTVSFIQMLKAFTPVITMAFLFAAGLEAPSREMVASVLVIALGTALAAYGEVAFDLLGVLIMLVSESAEAARLVMTQFLLVGLKMGPFEGVMYLAPICFAWLTLGAALLEWPAILRTGALAVPRAHWPAFLAAACMGFLINVLAFATIKLASSLTLKVLGTAKNALLIVAAMVLYGEVVTGAQGVGYLAATVAFAFYTRAKVRQIAAAGG